MRINVNNHCNVLTGDSTKNPRAAAEITIPRFRANLLPSEARELAEALLQAVSRAEIEIEIAKEPEPIFARKQMGETWEVVEPRKNGDEYMWVTGLTQEKAEARAQEMNEERARLRTKLNADHAKGVAGVKR